MQLLTTVSDVNDLIRAPGLQTISQRGEIGRGVVETAVALLNQPRVGRPGAVLVNQERILFRRQRTVGKHAHCALAFAGNAPITQLLHDRFQTRVVKAFPKRVIEFHTQARVNRIELNL